MAAFKNLMKPALLIILILFFLIIQGPFINEFPAGIHAWAQWDRYALSLGFLDNGFNLFKPQTFVYNHQFPSDWINASASVITATDLPLHEWIVALLMKATGSESILIFRLYILLFSVSGIFFLYRMALAVSGNEFKSFVITAFAATSPVFLFYAGSTLPAIPSLASAMAGMYFYVQFKQRQQHSYWNIAISFLTLAALTRTTFIIPLLSVIATELSFSNRKNIQQKKSLAAPVVSLIVIAGYFFYNRQLANTYGSMFLNELMPAKSWEQAKDCLHVMFENWKFEWFTVWHYLLLLLVWVYVFIRRNKGSETSKSSAADVLSRWLIICLIGCLLFFTAMLRQFPHHDYYFLDTFYLPLCILFMLLLRKIEVGLKKSVIPVAVSAMLVVMAFKANDKMNHRHENLLSERFVQMLKNFAGADEWLKQNHIPETAKILVMDVPAPNPSFILMKRKGFVILSSNIQRKTHIDAALGFPFDFAVMEKSRQAEIINLLPELQHHLVPLDSSDLLVLFKRRQ